MRKQRIGDRAKLTPLETPQAPQGPQGSQGPARGRPITHQEAWTKVSIVLFERQIADLDRLATQSRRTSGRRMNRAEIIRALVDGLIGSGLDLTKHASEATLRAHVTRRLRRP